MVVKSIMFRGGCGLINADIITSIRDITFKQTYYLRHPQFRLVAGKRAFDEITFRLPIRKDALAFLLTRRKQQRATFRPESVGRGSTFYARNTKRASECNAPTIKGD